MSGTACAGFDKSATMPAKTAPGMWPERYPSGSSRLIPLPFSYRDFQRTSMIRMPGSSRCSASQSTLTRRDEGFDTSGPPVGAEW